MSLSVSQSLGGPDISVFSSSFLAPESSVQPRAAGLLGVPGQPGGERTGLGRVLGSV